MAPRDIKHLFTEKGKVLEAIVIWGAKTLPEIQSHIDQTTIYQWKNVHLLIGELMQKGDVFMNDKGEYVARPQLELDYKYYEEHMDEWIEPPEPSEYSENFVEPEPKYPDIISTIKKWLKIEKPETYTIREHFYLHGHQLDIFTKFLITKAFNTIIAVNPFIDESTPTQLLVKARREGKTVVLVTRNSKSSTRKKVHEWLEKNHVQILYKKGLHAKILLVDDSIALVSSMNFQRNPTAGLSWEAGIVTFSKDIVEEIKESVTNLDLEIKE